MKRKLLFATFLLVFFNSIFAQQFPVSIIPRVKAPAPVNFYNYADDASLNSPLTAQIFLNDLTIPSRQIRLKTYFEGGNIRFSSKDFVVGAQDLFLEGGIPLTLRNTELAPYYRLENIQGISSSVYGQTIPEGSYNFCFEVYDYISGAKLSAKKCATVFIFKNEPPILNIPLTGSNIEPTDFENIIFQWTPRHINVSNVEYEFSIVEVWDNSVNPQTAFLSQIPIYEETTRRTTLIYGPDKPLLLPGRKYAWRVRAKALQGLEEIGLFKNQGYSEVFWFSRTAPCQVPQGISAEAKGTSKINVFWEQDPTVYSEYIIAYRENGKANANWFTKRTNSSWATIWNLKPGTTYEYKIKGKCSYQFSDYSELQYVTTDLIQNEDANYNCGIVPDEIAISNRNPHVGLTIGDEITAGDFKVIITEIQSQSNGRISGKGYVAIPYLKFARFGVTFSNILINTANQLAEGEIVTLYDPEFGKGASADVDVDVDISDGINGDDGIKDDLVEVDFVIDEVKIDANGAIVVTGTNGEEAIIPGDDDISIKSANGDVWSVGEDGTITKEEGAEGGAVVENTTNGIDNEGNVNSITATGVTVVFQESGDYYFDALPENTSTTFEKEYKILEANGTKYKVPYKAVSDIQGEDFITAKVAINDASISKEDIIFKTKDGAKVEANWNNNSTEVTLKLKRKFDYADEEIFAVVKSKEDNEKYDIAGSLITTHLASKELEAINVTLIPVGDGVVINDALKEKTAEIYSKAGVRLNIQTGQSILPDEVYGWDKDGNKRLKVGDSSILSHYTDEQLMFNNYVKQQEYYTDKTYYVFVTNISITNANVSGFMPLKRQFGFVFTQNATTVTKQSRTLAHELGHGIFGLEHTWDEYQFGQGATNFLMDYGSGTVLNHLDWKKMHAPGVQLYWFQGDEDGAYKDDEYLSKVFQKIRCEFGNGKIELEPDFFNKEGSFLSDDSNYGEIKVTLTKNKTALGKTALKIEEKASGGGSKEYTYKLYTLRYGGVEISSKWYNELSKTEENLEKLQNYLFPEDKSLIKEDYKEVLTRLEGKTELTDEDIVAIKQIANCGARYFSVEEKYSLISKIVDSAWVLDEYYEDLILDLVANYSQDSKLYSKRILELLITDKDLTKKLFNGISDEEGIYLWSGNENNFSRFLNEISQLLSFTEDDELIWEVINLFINIRFDDIEEKETKFLSETFSYLKIKEFGSDESFSIATLFVKMLKECENLKEHELLLDITVLRNQNREAFAAFTQVEKNVPRGETGASGYDQLNSLSWLVPNNNEFRLYLGGGASKIVLELAEDAFYWRKILTNEYPNQSNASIVDKNLSDKESFKYFLEKFKEEYINFLPKFENETKYFWDKYYSNYKLQKDKIDKDFEKILKHINRFENKKSLKDVNESVRLYVFERILLEPKFEDNVDPVYKGDFDNALSKVSRSFDYRRRGVINAFEKIGFDNISKNLHNERLTEFLLWISEYIIQSRAVEHGSPENELAEFDNIKSVEELSDNNKVIKLEANICQLQNVSAEPINKTTFKINQLDYEYNRMLYAIAYDDFKFFNKTYKKGTIFYIPAVQVYAMSKSNWDIVLDKSANVGVDVVSFAFGIGGVYKVFKAGTAITKAIATGGTISGGTDIVLGLLNESAISDEVKIKIQQIQFAVSLAEWGEMSFKIKKLINETEKKIYTESPNLSDLNQRKIQDLLDEVKSKVYVSELSGKFKELNLNNLKNSFDKLDKPTQIKFLGDFKDASDEVLKALDKDDAFKAWKHFRELNKSTTICN
ncbi:Fibronectin type III domain protein [Tenacibaculum discolor]